MRHQNTLLFLIATVLFVSCKKSGIEPTTAVGSLTVANAVVSGKLVYNGSFKQSASNNSYSHYALPNGLNDLYFWPQGDSLNPYYTQKGFTMGANEIYTLFLCGTTTAPDGVLMKENLPFRSDSSFGLRVINLSPNSTPLIVTLSTSTSVNEFTTNIAYKQITDFKAYPALYNSAYTFQVRAANNAGTVLATLSFVASSVPRFQNRTLVIRGLVGSTPAIGITSVIHDR